MKKYLLTLLALGAIGAGSLLAQTQSDRKAAASCACQSCPCQACQCVR